MRKLLILLLLITLTSIVGCDFLNRTSSETTSTNSDTITDTYDTGSSSTTQSVTDRTSNTALNSTDSTTITNSDTGLTTVDDSTMTTFPTSVTATFVIWTTTVFIENDHEQLLMEETGHLNLGEMDFYELNIVDSGTLNVYSTGELDLFGTLYEHDCTMVTYDDDSGVDDNFMIEITLEPGRYYLAVEGYEGQVEGNYGLNVNYLVDGPTSYMRVLSYEGITDSENTDWFEFHLYEPSYIDAYSMGSLDTYATLYNNGYVVLAENDDSGEGSNFKINTYLTEGIYYLAVETDGEGSYQLNIDYVENNFDYFFKVEGYLDLSEEPSYEFTLLEDGYVSITTLSSIDLYGSLYDALDELILVDDDGGIEHNIYMYAFLEAGTYQIEIKSYEGDEEGEYVLIIDFE